jgi:succinate-semialdehyde dehydrogenase/glutarate-semialdehyde dehydrogenase
MLRAVDPTNGRVIREVEPDSEAEVERKLDAAVLAFQGWRRASFDDRAKVLRAVASLMRDDIDRLGGLMTEEMGKPVREARGEVQKSAGCADH